MKIWFLKNKTTIWHLKISFKNIFLFLSVIAVYCLFFLIFYHLLKFNKAFPTSNIKYELKNYFLNFIPILFIAISSYTVVFKFNFKYKIFKNTYIKFLMDFITSFLILFIINLLFLFIAGGINPQIAKIDWVGSVLNSLLIFLSMEAVYYIIDSHKSSKQVELAKRKEIQYQYDSLKMQINPHFLFNSLNILYSLITIDAQKSKEFILALSSMYRYILEQQDKNVINLKDEYKFLTNYISVLKMRYHQQFETNIFGLEKIENKKIIPYTMQLLIENVTKHNIISTNSPMIVNIEFRDTLVLVSNPINKKENNVKSGIGLHYITEQYKLYGKIFEIENNDVTFIAKIPYL
jgi:two-component system, LytTR family, sensor kinase